MVDELITFETAILAKEKGFNWDCHWVLYRGTRSVLHKCPAMPSISKDLESGDYILQPTQTKLATWLREKCGIVVSVDVDDTLTYFLTITTIKDGKYIGNTIYGEYKTYELALETGLLDALGRI